MLKVWKRCEARSHIIGTDKRVRLFCNQSADTGWLIEDVSFVMDLIKLAMSL